MSEVDDGWSVVKLPEKGQLSTKGAVSDDFDVDDDDILSNTSSDDYADLSNPFNVGKKDPEKVKMISDSFDTLTGSRNCGLAKKNYTEGSEKTRKTPDDKERTTMEEILSKLKHLSKPELKVWHVAILSSLVTVLIIVGTQRYLQLFDGILLQRDGDSITHNSSNKDLIYSDINFLNRDESVSPTWRPAGKYYVDFDNHIAYPLPQKELLPWQKIKTDTVILWYTVRSKFRTWLNSEPSINFQRQCYTLLEKTKKDTIWAHEKFLAARKHALERLTDNLEILKERTHVSLVHLRQNLLVLRANFEETAKSYHSLLQNQLLLISEKASKGIKICNSSLVEFKLWLFRKPLPQLELLARKTISNVQRWSNTYGRKMKILGSNLYRKRSKFAVKRLSTHAKTCKFMSNRKCKNWQFSKINAFGKKGLSFKS